MIDNILRLAAIGGITATVLLAPGAIKLFDKPVQKYLKKLDAKDRERELRRTLSYIKYHKLVTDNYKHGLKITDKARNRLEQLDIEQLEIPQKKWDNKWRIIFYDIPEKHKSARNALGSKLRELGCLQLQRSVWVHPLPCQDEINAVAMAYEIEKYVTYIVASHINNQHILIKKFSHII